MIDDRTMADLRLAATLVHALPGVGLQVEGGDGGTTLEVGHGLDEGPGLLSPCGFRVAVGQAHRMRQAGREVGLIGVCPVAPPRLTLHGGDGASVRPGGICVVEHPEGLRVAAATVLDRDACHRELAGPVESVEDALAIFLHHDEMTEVTILHARVDDVEDLDLAVRAVEAALARCATAELLAELALAG